MPDSQFPPDGFTGTWVHERPDGSRWESDYVDGVRNGRVRIYGGTGKLLREGMVRNGQWHGQMRVWNSAGDLLDTAEFDRGSGVYRIFYSSGKLAWEIPICAGKPHGAKKRWDAQGRLVLVQRYEHGELLSEETVGHGT